MSVLYPNTGIFKAVLEEDFIETVRSCKDTYCKARVIPFYEGVKDYPWTYVSSIFFIHPLKKGDTIYVSFKGDDLKNPVLVRIENKVPTNPVADYDFPSTIIGGNVTFPETVSTFSFDYYSNDHYILKSDRYTVIHCYDTVFVLDKEKLVFKTPYAGLVANTFYIDATTLTIYVAGQKIEMGSTGIKITTVEGQMIEMGSTGVKITTLAGQITGGTLTINGVVTPTGAGPFCGIPICPVTGAPHSGSLVTGT